MADALLIPADGQVAVINELNTYWSGEASGQIPRPVPAKFFRVLPAGGFDRDLVTTVPIVIVESWSEDEDEAGDRCVEALGHLMQCGRILGAMGGFTCYEVSVVSLPASLPLDTLPTHFRYTTTISAALRSVAV